MEYRQIEPKITLSAYGFQEIVNTTLPVFWPDST